MFESSRAHHPHSPLQEIEIKLRLSTVAAAKRLLMQNGFTVKTPRHLERNLLLDTDPPTMRPAGMILRVRQALGETIVAHKSKGNVLGNHKVREELEVNASDFNTTLKIFANLGYQPAFRYDKYRTIFARARERGQVMLDETPIGAFLELEGPPAWIDRTAAMFGFAKADYVTDSYGALWMQHLKAAGLPPGDFVFPPRRKA